jgi:hypothetical protein
MLPSWHKALRNYVFQPKFGRKPAGTRTLSILRCKFCNGSIQTLLEWICVLCSRRSNILVLFQIAYHYVVIYRGRIRRTSHSRSKCAFNEQSSYGTWISWKRPNTLPNLWRQYQRFECYWQFRGYTLNQAFGTSMALATIGDSCQ